MPAYFQDNSKLIRVDRLRNSKIIDLAVRAEPEHPKPLHDSLVGRWSVPAFMDTELGCQLTELPIP